MRKLLTAAAVIVIGVTGAAGANVAAAAPDTHQPRGGTEYVQIMSTATTGDPAGAIAHGVFTAAGQADLGSARIGRLVFPGGAITLSHRASHGTSQLDPRTCLNLISQVGTYQIVSGTGHYGGIHGHGTYQLSLEFISVRAYGQCTASRPPGVRQELLRLSGPVQL